MRIGLVISLVFSLISLSGQSLSPSEIQFLNREIRFLNESIHRMVIVFQIFENYNSEVTQHVDLPINEGIKNTSGHLPPNLFADNNLVRRGDSPLELFDELSTHEMKDQMPINSWSMILQARAIIDYLNQDRQELDRIIDEEDLFKFHNIQTIYREIKNALEYFDRFRMTVKMFETVHLSAYHELTLSPERRQVYTALIELHYDIKKLLRQLREDNQSGVIQGVPKLIKELGWVKTCITNLQSADERREINSAVVSIEKLVDQFQSYVNGVTVPEEYRPFGNGYYYHNYELLPKVNEYGSGYVWKLEEFFTKFNWPVIHFLEEPHYIKIVYPKRIPLKMMEGDAIDAEQDIREINPPSLPQLAPIVVATTDAPVPTTPDTEIEELQEAEEEIVVPEEIKYDIVHQQSISVDSDSFQIELFDHLSRDGDRVSINVNGTWRAERISLETAVQRINMVLDAGGVSYLIIRADNTGWRPPNTIGFRYRGKVNGEVFIKKDLETSQAIELKFTN